MDYNQKVAKPIICSIRFFRIIVFIGHSDENPSLLLHNLPEKHGFIQEMSHRRSLFPKEDRDTAMPRKYSINFAPEDGHLNAKTRLFPSPHRKSATPKCSLPQADESNPTIKSHSLLYCLDLAYFWLFGHLRCQLERYWKDYHTFWCIWPLLQLHSMRFS